MSHRSPITCVDTFVASDASGDLRCTGGYDGRVVLWNADGTQRWWTEFDDLVNDVRISPDGQSVAVAVADRFAFVLDVADGARIEVFGPHGDDVNAVRWSPDGHRLACVMDHLDTTIRVWEQSPDSWFARTLDGHASGVFAVAFDPSGDRLATVAEDSTARIWNVATGEQLHVLQHPGDPEALDWSPTGSVVVTGCDDGIARVWDPSTGALVRELHEANAAVRFIRFDRTGERVLIGSYDATMRVYECTGWTVTDALSAPFQWERAGAFARDRIVVGSFGAEGAEHGPGVVSGPTLPPPTLGINAICAAGGRLLIGRDDGAVVDVLRGEVLARHDTIVNAVTVAPNGAVVASGDYRGGVRLTPLAGVGSAISVRADGGGPINSIVWRSDDTFFSGGYDGCVRRWNADGTCVAKHRAHHGPIKSLAWSNAADALIAGSSDGSLSAWRGEELLWRASADDLVLVNAVACADGPGVVASASRDLAVRLWDASTGRLIETLDVAHLKSVKAIAIDHDGTTILTGSYDGTAVLWRRRARGWAWTPLRLHAKPGVPAVAMADGSLFTAGWNGTVGRWSMTGALTAEYRADAISAR